MRDAEIFVARAMKIYQSEQRSELFLFTLKRTSLLLVSDPSLLTLQDLTTHMKAMDPLRCVCVHLELTYKMYM